MSKSVQLFSSKAYACGLAAFQSESLGEVNGFKGYEGGGGEDDGARAIKMKGIEDIWAHPVDFAAVEDGGLAKLYSDNRDLGLHESFSCEDNHFNRFEEKESLVEEGAVMSILHQCLVNVLVGVEEVSEQGWVDDGGGALSVPGEAKRSKARRGVKVYCTEHETRAIRQHENDVKSPTPHS